MQVDLYELSNNHVWRTGFLYRDWTREMVPPHMRIETDERGGLTEWGWIDFGFKTYYALLDCGFRLRPTAGTASGVHPVPLGFGRVYVHLPRDRGGFDYAEWIKGLNAGRSFVTTGPMLLAEFNGQPPGHVFRAAAEKATCHVKGVAESALPLERIEIVVNGAVRRTVKPANERTSLDGCSSPLDEPLALEGGSWVAVRCFEKQPDGRLRFAHTAPVHFEVPNRPLRPRRDDVQYFITRMEEEIARNRGVLSPAALKEYETARGQYTRLLEKAARE